MIPELWSIGCPVTRTRVPCWFLIHGISAAQDSVHPVEYVPHAFGFKAMNLPFCCWLWARRRHKIFVMFHEVAFGSASLALEYNVLALITKLMATLVARAASRIFCVYRVMGANGAIDGPPSFVNRDFAGAEQCGRCER